MTEERKFTIQDKGRYILTFVSFPLLFIGCTFICILNLFVGLFLIALLLIMVLWMLLIPQIVVFSSSCIKTKTGFGKIKKTLYWSDLKKITVRPLIEGMRFTYDYCIFIFTVLIVLGDFSPQGNFRYCGIFTAPTNL